MLKDHKSAMHQEGVTFDKVIRNLNKTEQFLIFLLFYDCQLEMMRFIHSFDNMFLFSNHNVTHMNVSKQYNENRGVRALLTIRKHQRNLLPSSNFLPKMVPLTGTVPLTYFMGYSESILCILLFISFRLLFTFQFYRTTSIVDYPTFCYLKYLST